MGLWFRLRFGPFGYTVRGRRKPQNYRAYKASRDRRADYAVRYEREKVHERENAGQGTHISTQDKLAIFAGFVLVVLLSPIVVPIY